MGSLMKAQHRDTETQRDTEMTTRFPLRELTHQIIAAAIEVHRELGPGLLESTYEACLCEELRLRGLKWKRQLSVPIRYKNVMIQEAYRIDLVVEDQVVIELKSIESLAPIHEVQVLTYLKHLDLRVGLLINFNVAVLKDGIKRVVN
jgi:GxxExxY protein